MWEVWVPTGQVGGRGLPKEAFWWRPAGNQAVVSAGAAGDTGVRAEGTTRGRGSRCCKTAGLLDPALPHAGPGVTVMRGSPELPVHLNRCEKRPGGEPGIRIQTARPTPPAHPGVCALGGHMVLTETPTHEMVLFVSRKAGEGKVKGHRERLLTRETPTGEDPDGPGLSG